jgi:uncharacterized protein YecE (DUF72 family)
MREGQARVGTSGWRYPPWRGDFYPRGLPQRRELAYLAERLPTVEINGTFYSLTRPDACAAWRADVPDHFVFAIKGSRYITHMLKLRHFEKPLANFFSSGLLRLGATLGPILWQMPPQLPYDDARVRAFFDAVPRDIAADTAGKHPFSLERTADFAYVRLHGSTSLYASRYTDAELAGWADRIAAWTASGADAYVYFDNDARGHAPHDALRLQAALEAKGRPRAVARAASRASTSP